MRYAGPLLLAALLAACAATPGARTAGAGTPATGILGVPGGNLFYEVQGDGPPVVLIHGGFMDRRMWDDQFATFARQGYTVIRYDLRGFGLSSLPEEPYAPVDDLDRLLAHLKIPKAHLVGLSMGGNVALDYALEHPERVASLVLAASGPGGYPVPEADRQRIVQLFTTAREQGVSRAVDLWLAHPMNAAAAGNPAVHRRIGELSRENGRFLLLEFWPMRGLEPPAYGRLGEVRVPTLVIAGGRDTPINQEIAAAAATGIAGARRSVLADAGHMLNMEEPQQFNRLVLGFLKEQASP